MIFCYIGGMGETSWCKCRFHSYILLMGLAGEINEWDLSGCLSNVSIKYKIDMILTGEISLNNTYQAPATHEIYIGNCQYSGPHT